LKPSLTINGYFSSFADDPQLGDVLVDGWMSYSSTPFLAAHLLAQGIDEELVFDALGISKEDAQDAYWALTSERAWPVFRVPLKYGHSLTCVYRNWEDAEAIDYLLEFGDSSPCIELATVKAELLGPGISWRELYAAVYASSLPEQPTALRLLFLTPMMGDGEAGSESANIMAEIMSPIAGEAKSRLLASALIDNSSSMWGRPRWTLVDNDCMICDGRNSPRNPNRKYGLDRKTLVKITHALAP
jgi:hypothetical protein